MKKAKAVPKIKMKIADKAKKTMLERLIKCLLKTKKLEEKMSVRKANIKADFVCPICNSKEYLEKWKSNEIFGPGGKSCITGYVCAGYSVRFDDPEKFSKKVKTPFRA